MQRLNLAFFLSSVVFLCVAVVATVHVTSSPAQTRLVEISVEGFGPTQVDRCPTCHVVGVGEEFSEDHPSIPGSHPVERFGCTSCHGGEPRALEKEWAHLRGREPLFHQSREGEHRPERLESGCARCHVEVTSTSLIYDSQLLPHVSQGQILFVSRGCWGCHRVADQSLGERGPDLSDVGARLDGDSIHQAIEDPSAAPSSTTMPRFRLTETEIRDLVAFLLAQVGEERQAAMATSRILAARRPGAPPGRPPVNEGMAQGGDIMLNMGCAGCHRLQARDGRVGPDLRWEGKLRGPQYLRDMLTRPSQTVVGSRMPPVDLTESELAAVIQFLSRQRESSLPDAETVWRSICARCHGLDGRGRTAVSPYLGWRPRDLSSEEFFRGVEPSRLVQSLMKGVPGTPMARWGEAMPVLSGKRVVSFIGRKLHQGGLPSPRRPEVPPEPEKNSESDRDAAEDVFRIECSACHGPSGRGDGPEAAGLRPRPRDLGNGAFIASLGKRRLFLSIGYGPVGSAMPGHLWGNSPTVVWALVAKVRQIAGDPLTGSYEEDRWPWESARKRRRGGQGRNQRRRSQGRSKNGREPAQREVRLKRSVPVKAVPRKNQ